MPKSSILASASVLSRQRRRQIVVRVRRVPLAAALALGSHWPLVAAQAQVPTVITAISGNAATQTVVGTPQTGLKTVTTATLRDGNAFNNFALFQVGSGDTVRMVVPTGARWLVNVVRDGRVQVDGNLQSSLGSVDGALGGNLLFISSHGFAVGANGRVDTGRLVFAAPSTSFVNGLLADGPGLSASRVSGVLGGSFDRSDTGVVRIDGEINARDGVHFMAGRGQGAAQAVALNGTIRVDGPAAGSAVNLGDLRSLSPVVDRDGVIDITTPGDVMLNGKLLSDGSHWTEAGAVRVVAGGDIQLGSQALASASAAQGSGGKGGLVSLFAHRDASNAPGAILAARGDGAGDGGFVELSAARSVTVGGLTMDAGSDSGRSGLALIDPVDLVVSASNYTNGTNLSLEATSSLKVKAGVTLNTRQVAGSASEAAALLAATPDAASTGNSGSISLAAPSIVVEGTAVLDASAVNQNGTTYAAGDVKLLAESAGNWLTTLPGVPVGFADANATIDVAGVLKGRDVTLAASIKSDANFDGASAVLSQGAVSLALQQMGTPLALSLSYMEAIGNAKVAVRDTAELDASRDISLTAMADRSAGAALQTNGGAANLAAGFARIAGTTSVTVESGASLQAAGNIGLVAASKTKVNMTAAAMVDTITSGQPSMAAIVFGGSMSDVNTSVSVADGAMLNAGGDVTAQAFHQGSYQTGGTVKIYGDGKAGLVGALSLQKSDTSVSLGGDVGAGGNISATALSVLPQTVVSATSENSAELPLGGLDSLPATTDLTDDQAKAKLATGFVAMLSSAYQAAESGAGSSGSGSSGSGGLRLAGAMTWSESDHKTRATISSGAKIAAGGNAVVDAQALVGRLQGVAEAGAEAAADSGGASVSLSAAISWADHSYTTSARVGQQAEIDAAHVAVHAATEIPEFFVAAMPEAWDNFGSVYNSLMTIRDPLGMLYSGFNTHVSAASAAGTAAVSGAVNVTKMRLDTRAWVDTDARVTTTAASDAAWTYELKEVPFDSDVSKTTNILTGNVTYLRDTKLDGLADFADDTRRAYPDGGPVGGVLIDEVRFKRSVAGTVAVQAENHVETLHLAGKPNEGTTAEDGGVAAGGTYSRVDRRNTAVAGIGDGVTISTRRLDVTAQTKDLALTITPSAGQGDGIAASGMVSDTLLDETTLASISREALVTASTGVNVNAELSLWTFGVTGAVTKTNNSGVGVGVAMNELKGRTQAYIGDNDADEADRAVDTAEGAVGYVQAPQVKVNALSQGMIGAVGVAGAMASTAAPGSNLADGTSGKAETKSSGATATADSNASLAPLGGATGDMQAQGAGGDGGGSGGTDASAADQAPPFQIAGAGGVVTNFSDVDTIALVDGAMIKPMAAGATSLGVRAISDLTQVSVAGGAALTMSSNPTTTFSSSIAGAVAIQQSDDDTQARIVDSTVKDLADSAGALTVQALKSGERTAVATGISLNLSSGSKTSLSLVGSVSMTESTDDTAASIEDSTITGKVATPSALDAQIVAYDRSRVGAGGGALSVSTGKGAAGIGAAITLVDLKGSTTASLVGGSMSRVHDLTVAGLSSQKVVGVGAVAGVQTSSDATSLGQAMGAFVFNNVNNTVAARVTGAAAVNLSGDLTLQAGGAPADKTLDDAIGAMRQSLVTDYEMSSADNGYSSDFKAAVGGGESIVGVAGTLGVSLGSNSSSAGLSYAQNSIQSLYDAELNGTIIAAGDVRVDADSAADIVGVSAGVGVTKGKFSGMGSASVNLIGQRTRARLTGGSVTAANLDLDADTTGQQFGMAGNLSFAVGGGTGVAGGAAIAYNQTGTRTYTAEGASVGTRGAGNEAAIDSTTVNVGAGRVQVLANNASDIRAVAAAGAATTGKAAFAGTATWNEIGDVTSALIDRSLVTAGTVTVSAGEASGGDTASIRSLAGGVSASQGFSGALAFGFNTIESVRSARVLRSNLIAGSSVKVESASQGAIQSLAATIAGSANYAAAGTSTVNWLNADVLAEYDADGDGVAGGAVNSLRGTASSLTVRATGSGSIESLAGSVSGSGSGAAIGGAVSVNRMGQDGDTHRVRASLSNIDLLTSQGVAVTVDAKLTSSIGSIAASGGGSGTSALNGSVTTNAIAATVQAEASRVRTTPGSDASSVSTFAVRADNAASIDSLAGTVSGGGTAAVGAAVSVNDIGGEVKARLADTGLANSLGVTGSLTVDAASSGTIRSVAAGMSGGGTVGAAGSNTTNGIHSTVLAQVDKIDQWRDPASVTVRARDTSTIESLAGTVTGGGTAAGGAALALNFLGRTATDQDSRKVVKAEVNESIFRVTGDVTVSADSTSTIRSVGVAAGLSGTAAINGSNATNLLEDEVTAYWSNSAVMPRLANRTLILATQDATIESLAGNISGTGGVAIGAAVAVNRIGTATHATMTAGAGTFRTDTMVLSNETRVSADSSNEIDTIAVGMSAGTAGAQGSVAVSVIESDTQALMGGNDYLTNVSARGTVAVTANSHDRIRALAGAAGLGLGGVGLAGGVLTNIIDSNTTAGIDGRNVHVEGAGQGNGITVKGPGLSGSPDLMAIDEVTDSVLGDANFETRTAKGLLVQATAIQQIGALTAVAGGGTVGAGAAVNVDKIGGSTRAYMNAVPFVNVGQASTDPVYDRTPAASQAVDVMAANHALVASSVTALAGGGVAVGAAVGTELIDRSTRAEILGTRADAAGAVAVNARSTNSVAQMSVGIGGGGVGVAGSGDAAIVQGETVARIANSTVNADTVSVTADGGNHFNLIAGSVGGGAVGGGGLSFTVGVSGSTVRALVEDSVLRADGAVVVDADNTTEVLSVSATGARGGVGVGVAVGAAVTVLEGNTEAAVTGSSNVGRRTRATGLVASAGDAPVTISLASDYDHVDATEQRQVRFTLNDTSGRVLSTGATVTVAGESATTGLATSVTAVRQSDGSYVADVSGLADGVLEARAVITEGEVSKLATTHLVKSTDQYAGETMPDQPALGAAATRIATLSGFETVDGRNQSAVRFVLKDDQGLSARADSAVTVSDGKRVVTATRNSDGTYTADVRTLGDGMLTALVTVDGDPATTSRVTFLKDAGAASLSITANERLDISNNAGAAAGGVTAGAGLSANVVVGRSKVDASLTAASVRVAGDLTVSAARDATIDMLTVSAGMGNTAGISGSVGVLVFGAAPDSDGRAELDRGGSSSALSQVSAATRSDRASATGSALSGDESDALNDSTDYDTAAAFGGASGKHRTSATISAGAVRAGNVNVSSVDRTAVSNRAGAVGVGGAGVGLGVAVTQLGGANAASVSATELIAGGNVTVDAGARTPAGRSWAVDNFTVQGSGGFVGVGAAVSVARNETASSAAIGGKVQAEGAVSVIALDDADLRSQAYGGAVGAIAANAVVATASQQGSVTTQAEGTIGAKGLTIEAERDSRTNAYAKGGAAGAISANAAVATAADSGNVQVTLATGTRLDAGSGALSVAARANPHASAEAMGVTVATGAAVGASVATATTDTHVSVESEGALALAGATVDVAAVLGAGNALVDAQATAGGGGLLLGLQGAGAVAGNSGLATVTLTGGATLAASGNASIAATNAMAVDAHATGVGAGGLAGLGVAVSDAHSTVNVGVDAGTLEGRVGGNLGVSGRGSDRITSNAIAGAGGALAGAGAESTVTHDMAVSALVDTKAGGLRVDGVMMVSAERNVDYDNLTNTVSASAFGAAGAVNHSTLTGSAVARLDDGAKLVAGQLRVMASNDVERTNLNANNADGGGGGVISGAGVDVSAVIDGTAKAEIGNGVSIDLGRTGETVGLLELRAYNQLRGSARGQLDVGGAVPIALAETEISSTARAEATVGATSSIDVLGEVHGNALSWVDIAANTITKTFGAAAGAQGDSDATATVDNIVTVGRGTTITGDQGVTLLAGRDRDWYRNKSFVTAQADLFNHSAIPVSINPTPSATLTLNNQVNVDAANAGGTQVRSGGTIQLGGIEGSVVVEGKGKVSDWTRDLGEAMGISSEYGSSTKTLNSNTVLNGAFEAGYGNQQRLVIGPTGEVTTNEGNIRYTVTTEDLAATGVAYLDSLKQQLARYGDVPAVRAYVEAEVAFYEETLLREGFAERMADGTITPRANVPATFLNLYNVRAGSGNIELFGNNVSGRASLVARADSLIDIDNKSPMNLRVNDLTVDSSGGFALYNGTFLKGSADISTLNRDVKTGLNLSVDSIDTRKAAGVSGGEALPVLRVVNSYVPTGSVSSAPLVFTAPDGTSADLREDQIRAPEMRVNGTLYNKLGDIKLSNTAGSISVIAEKAGDDPRLDGMTVDVAAGKNFVLSSPSISQSVGGSPESLYAVYYSETQRQKLANMGITACGSAVPGNSAATTVVADCYRPGTGGIYASGAIFLGARYLNINGTIQSGQADYKVDLTDAKIGTTISNWESTWTANRGTYLAQGRSPLVQVAGRLSTDSEADVNKRFANGTITVTQRDSEIAAIRARSLEPIVYYDAEADVLKLAPTEAKGGLVELVGSIINTGGGVVRALDGYARFDIKNQTGYTLDLQGLDTGGDKGVVRITDLSRPYCVTGTGASIAQVTCGTTGSRIAAYEVTTYQRDAAGAFKAVVTAGRGGATLSTTSGNTAAVTGRPELRATFAYSPLAGSTYAWSAGYDYATENRYWYQRSSYGWGLVNGKPSSWDSTQVFVKTAQAMPEDVYVATSAAEGALTAGTNFSIGSQTFTTAAEKQIYFRSWKKCGFLCFKKTYYVDYRTESGKKDVFTQRVRADYPIKVELVGYDTGNISVVSKGGVRVAGDIVNETGTVSITSNTGSIQQTNIGATVSGVDLNFVAANGIGTSSEQVKVATGTGFFTAKTTKGDVAILGESGALRIKEVSTGSGRVWLTGEDGIVGAVPSQAIHVKGNRVELNSARGGIGEFNADGSVKATLNIETEASRGGGVTATAARGIALKEATGDLWIDQINSRGGDVYVEAPGDFIDNNRNETRDLRTEAELLSLWSQAALQGSGADTSRQLALRNTREQFSRYWSLRNARSPVYDADGKVTSFTADSYDPATSKFQFSSAERAQLASSGLSGAQITDLETLRTQELKNLHSTYGTTTYQTDPDQIIAAVNDANLKAGKEAIGANSTWSDKELKSPLPKGIFSKSTTSTQTRIEEPNVVGSRVVLRPGGKIGKDDGTLTIDLLKDGGLTSADQLAIMSAESSDMVMTARDAGGNLIDMDKLLAGELPAGTKPASWTLAIAQKDTFDVLSSRLNLRSSGFVYLGANGNAVAAQGVSGAGSANLESVVGTGEIRIKVSDSITNMSSGVGPVIQGRNAVLEAATGSIGTAERPITMTLTGGTQGTLVARAEEGIWINQTGDIRMADVYSPGFVALTAQGAIIDSRGHGTRSIEAGEATLTALGGTVGTATNPIVAKMSSAGGVNASTPVGYSVFLQGAETGLTVKDINSGLDVSLYALTGDLRARGTTKAIGRIDAQTEAGGDFSMASGSTLQAVTGDVYVSADDVGLSKLEASRAVVVSARGSITDTSEALVNANATGRGVTLTAAKSIGTREKPVDVLTLDRTQLVAIARDGGAFVNADTGILRISQVSATGDAVLGSAYSILDERGAQAQAVSAANIEFVAGGDVGLAATPMTVKMSPGGVVRQAAAGGSVFLKAPSGVLEVVGASAGKTGRIVLDGTTYGLSLSGVMRAGSGISLSSGSKAITFSADADVGNSSGSVVVQGASVTMADGSRLDGGAGTVSMSAAGDITLTGVSSGNASASAIAISSTGGAVRDGGDTNAYDLRASSATGGIVVNALGHVGDATRAADSAARSLETDAPFLQVTSKTGSVVLAQGARATRGATITAGTSAELTGEGSITASKVAALRGDARVTSQDGDVKLTSITSTQDVIVSAGGRIDLTSVSVPRDITVTSSGAGDLAVGRGIAATSLVAGRNLLVNVAGMGAHASLGTLTAKAGAMTLVAGGTLTATGTTSALGSITADAVGNATFAGVSSTGTAGIIDLESSGGMLTTGAVAGALDVKLKSSAALKTTTLTSRSATVRAESLLDSVTVSSVSARSAILGAGTTLSLGSFTLSAGEARLTAGTGLTVSSGTAYGGITITMGGVGSLGNLTSTTGSISAESTAKGMSFGTLKAATGIVLRAKAAMGLGTNASYALFGTSLDAGKGGVDASAQAGHIQIGTLRATTASSVKALGGNLKISTVYMPKLVKLDTYAFGTKTLPAGY